MGATRPKFAVGNEGFLCHTTQIRRRRLKPANGSVSPQLGFIQCTVVLMTAEYITIKLFRKSPYETCWFFRRNAAASRSC